MTATSNTQSVLRNMQRRAKAANHIFNQIYSILSVLYSRWLDEAEYEDINEYGKVIEKNLSRINKKAKFVKMHKRPFGFTYTLLGATFRVKINSKVSEFLRIK